MLSNFHTHTVRCKHAIGTERDYTETAVSKGLNILGFSDHGPFPDKDYGLRMQFEELPDYLEAIRSILIIINLFLMSSVWIILRWENTATLCPTAA